MRRWWSAAAALAVALTVALVWLAVGESPQDTRVSPAADVAASPGGRDEAGRDDPPGRDRTGPPRWVPGPPPWAHRHGRADRPGTDGTGGERGWHPRWRAMSPQERERTMRELARKHHEGMRAWARCVADGRDDCERPRPPGLAQKQPGTEPQD